jgi:hypothetical protein
MFETAGYAGQAGSALELVSAATGQTIATIQPSRLAGNSWRAAYAPAPDEPALLRMRAASAAHWIAISEPIEMSALGYRAWQLAKHGRWVFFIGLIGGLIVAGVALFLADPVAQSPSRV